MAKAEDEMIKSIIRSELTAAEVQEMKGGDGGDSLIEIKIEKVGAKICYFL